MNTRTLIIITSLLATIVGCNESRNDDVIDTVNKNGAIETAVKVEHLNDATDILMTTHKVWVKQDLYKTVEYRDTLPTLGIENTVAENEQGDSRSVAIPKDYEIYITVK